MHVCMYVCIHKITYQQSHFYQMVDIIFWYIKENEKVKKREKEREKIYIYVYDM